MNRRTSKRFSCLLAGLVAVLLGDTGRAVAQSISVVTSKSQSCVAPGAQITLGGTGTMPINGAGNPDAFLCCPPGTVFGTPITSATGGAPNMTRSSSFTGCGYDANLPYNGVAVQLDGTGSWPNRATETLKVPVTVPATTAPGTQFSCWLKFTDLVSSCAGDAYVTVPVSQSCNPPTPTVTKGVGFLPRTSSRLMTTTGSQVWYQIDISNSDSRSQVTDVLPSDFQVEKIWAVLGKNDFFTSNPSACRPNVLPDGSRKITCLGDVREIIIFGHFDKIHSNAVQNIANFTDANGHSTPSNPVLTYVGSPALWGIQVMVDPNSVPGRLWAWLAVVSAPPSDRAASLPADFAWLASDVDAFPAATGASLTRTFAKPGQYTLTAIAEVNGLMQTKAVLVNVGALAPGCHPDANTLCLGANGRFKVQVDWQDLPNQHNGVANSHPITTDTGAFWFFDPSNLELVVKVLDGTALNQNYWVFYGALSNVQYEIKITDTVTGAVQTYTNLQGTQASGSDTSAFPRTAAADAAPASGDESMAADLTPASGDSLACTTGGNNLCLDGRFQVSVAWNDVPNQHSGSGTPVSLTSNSGYMWFFSSSNVELILKIVDGRGLNGHFWFFYGALSNVQYTITVTDTQTGAQKTYNNPQGTQASQADTSAF